MLGGKIDIVSTPGKGTTIKVELPIGQENGVAALPTLTAGQLA
jgi:signal transduction histidine kinase